MAADPTAPLLEVTDLSISFAGIDVVDQVSFSVAEGEVLGLVGESGCGKSVTAQAVMRLLPPHAKIRAARMQAVGRDLLTLSERAMQACRGAAMSMIFQEPMTALNPVLSIGRQIGETLARHAQLSRRAARERSLELLARVGIPAPRQRLDEFPHQLSGGMRQRVMIAMAIACNPRLLFADEPTTALDVTIQAQILELLRGLQEEYRMGIVLISHDLAVVSSFADKVAVMYAGRIVERAAAAALFAAPAHPYADGLLASLPGIAGGRKRLRAIPGMVPPPSAWPNGCRFHPRCAQADATCRETVPGETIRDAEHHVACHHPVPVRPRRIHG
jgi:peptide/nickel transport system ATP-binding protein